MRENKGNKGKELIERYQREEARDLARGNRQGSKLTISNSQIRQVLYDLLRERDRVLLSSISRILAEEYHEEKNVFKTRVRVMSAVRTKTSGLDLVNEDGRVWVVRK